MPFRKAAGPTLEAPAASVCITHTQDDAKEFTHKMHHAAPLPHAVWPMPLCCLETPAASARDCQCSSEVAALTRVPLRVSTRVSIMQARAPVLRLHMLCHTTAVGCAGCSSGHASNPFRHLLCQQPMRWHCLWRGGVSQDVATYLPTYLPTSDASRLATAYASAYADSASSSFARSSTARCSYLCAAVERCDST